MRRYAYACLLFTVAAVLVAWPTLRPRAGVVSRRDVPRPELIPTPAPVPPEIEDLFAEPTGGPEELPAPGWRAAGCQAHLAVPASEPVTYVVIAGNGQKWKLVPATVYDAERHGKRAMPAYLLFEGSQVVQYGVWVPSR